MSDESLRLTVEILSAPGLDELQALAESHEVCEVVIISPSSERVTLQLSVIECKQEIDPRLGTTWPIARVAYASVANADDNQQSHTGHFAARQVHDWEGAFNHGTMEEL